MINILRNVNIATNEKGISRFHGLQERRRKSTGKIIFFSSCFIKYVTILIVQKES